MKQQLCSSETQAGYQAGEFNSSMLGMGPVLQLQADALPAAERIHRG